MEESSKFGTVDYLVFGLVLVISALIGVYYRLTGGKQQTTNEYLMADKSMSAVPVAFSLAATFMSAITMLGVPKEIYVYGTQYTVIIFGYLLGIVAVAFLYLPVFFKLQNTSAYEYLELRFGRLTRLVVSGSFIFQMTLFMPIVMYAPAIALSAATGFTLTASTLSVGLVCTFYSTLGGMKAVLWTDVFQAILMFMSVLAVIIKVSIDEKGLVGAWNIAVTGGRISFFDFNPDPTARTTIWTQVIGGMFTLLMSYAANQSQVQRLLTVPNLSKSRLALFISYPLTALLTLLTSLSGLVIYFKYHNCDPLLSRRISKSDQLLPVFIVDFLSYSPGLAGLLVSGIFCAALSSISSVITALAAVTIEDFMKPVLKRRVQHFHSDKAVTILTKSVTCTFGILCVALTFFVDRFGGVLRMAYTILGIIGGPTLGIFSLGMFCPRSAQRGAIISFLIGLAFSSWIGFGANIARPRNPTLPTSVDGCPAVEVSNELITANLAFNNVSLHFSGIMQQHRVPLDFSNSTPINKFKSNTSDHNKSILYLYRISFMWIAPLGFLTVMLVGVILSFCETRRHIHPDLLSPIWSFWNPNAANINADGEDSVVKASSRIRAESKYDLVSL